MILQLAIRLVHVYNVVCACMLAGRSYFEAGSDSDDGEARQRSARPGQGRFGDEDELTGGAPEVEEDPLDAFMAGIEVARG